MHGISGPDTAEQPRRDIAAIVPLHTAVAGRVRVQIGGLRGSAAIEDLLECGAAASQDIREIRASALTGNAVIVYAQSAPLSRILDHLAGLLNGDILPPGSDTEAAASHKVDVEALASRMGTSPELGLTREVALERLARSGPNVIGELKRRSQADILATQFNSLPVALLAGAAAFSVLTGGILEAIAILAVVGLNGVIGYKTESAAEHRIASLEACEPGNASVVRDGETQSVPIEDVVPGDLMSVQRGDVVPADARLVHSHALTVSEAMLTGESVPVAKCAGALSNPATPLTARANMIYRGTIVTGGRGQGIVVETGAGTQEGRIQQLVGTTATPETVIQKELRHLGWQLVWLTLAASATIGVIGLLRGAGLLRVMQTALSIAVAAVPEGLPMIATTTLALGVDRLRRKDVFARTLPAVESLAAVQTICFDKTGTLTRGQISVETMIAGDAVYKREGNAILDSGGRQSQPLQQPSMCRLLEICCLCNDAEIIESETGRNLQGSHTEAALLQSALDCGLDAISLRRDLPRASVQERTESYRFMATAHRQNGKLLIAMKGNPEEVLDRCSHEMLADGGCRPLREERRAEIRKQNFKLASRALRVLGVAQRRTDGMHALTNGALTELTWIGLVGMSDPIRPDMAGLMARLHGAGIQTIMLTGDQKSTACAVGAEVGLNGGGGINVVDAAEFESLPPDVFADTVSGIHAFSRVSPSQKLEVVRALQRSGKIVAMVGDGFNDGPALRAADVGIAVGDDGAATWRVADIFIGGDNLSALLDAVGTSRTAHRNIRKSIRYLVSTNLSEVLLVLVGTGAGLQAPLSPMQLLWINLVTDVLPGIGLALEPPGPLVLEDGPAGIQGIAGQFDLGGVAREGMILTAGGLAAALWGARVFGPAAPQVRTMTFGSLVLAQLLHGLSSRSRKYSVFSGRLPSNRALFLILGGSLALQGLAFALPPVRAFLGLAPLRLREQLVTLACGVLPFAAIEALKLRSRSPRTKPNEMIWTRRDGWVSDGR